MFPRLPLPSSWLSLLLPVGTTAALAAALGSGRTAQAIGQAPLRGRVVTASGQPVGGAQLVVIGTGVRAESAEDGRFLFARLPDGVVVMHVRRIGFRPESLHVAAPATGRLELTVTLEAVPVALRPMLVIRRRVVAGPMAGFYARRASGSGRFFTAEEIERRNPNRLSDLLRMVPGIRIVPRGMMNGVRVRGSRCAPLVWLDGHQLSAAEFDLDAVSPRSFDGIEVYSGPASVPVEFQGNRMASSACGTVILWTKRGESRAARVRPGARSPAAEIVDMVNRGEVYTDADVDVRARIDSATLVLPVYPDALYDAAVPGHLVAEFVVSATGEVLIDSYNVVTTTHRELVEPVRRALRTQRFVAAQRGGISVSQVVQQPFDFAPDSSARRR